MTNKPTSSTEEFRPPQKKSTLDLYVSMLFFAGCSAISYFSWKPWYAIPIFTSMNHNNDFSATAYTPYTLIITSGIIITSLAILCGLTVVLGHPESRKRIYSIWGMVIYSFSFPFFVPLLSPQASFQANIFNFEQTVVHDFLGASSSSSHIPWTPFLKTAQYPKISLIELEALKGYLVESNVCPQINLISFLKKMGFNNGFYSYLKQNYLAVMIIALSILLLHYIYTRKEVMTNLWKDISFSFFFMTGILLIILFFYGLGNYHYYVATQYHNKGLKNKALEHFQWSFKYLPGLSYNLSTLYNIGDIHHDMNKVDSGYYWFFRAVSNLKKNELQRAKYCILQSHKYLPSHVSVRYLAYQTSCRQGIEKYKKKAYHSASALFSEAIQYYPGGLTALYNLGLVHTKIGSFGDAEQYFKRFTALTKLYVRPSEISHCRIHFLMAWGQFQLGNLEKAMKYYRKGLTLPARKTHQNLFTVSTAYTRTLKSLPIYEIFPAKTPIK